MEVVFTSKKDHRKESRGRDNGISSQGVDETLKDLEKDLEKGPGKRTWNEGLKVDSNIVSNMLVCLTTSKNTPVNCTLAIAQTNTRSNKF